MKRILSAITVIISLTVIGMQQEKRQKVQAQTAQEVHRISNESTRVAKIEGLKQFINFKQFIPKHLISENQISKDFSYLFYKVPAYLRQSVLDYAEFSYGALALQKIKELYDNRTSLVVWKWNALGLAYNVMPFYNPVQNFFYFEQSYPNSTMLKGKREDIALSEYIEAEQESQKLKAQLEDAGALFCEMETEYQSRVSNPDIDRQYLQNLKIDLETLRKNYRVINNAYLVTEAKKINLGEQLVQEYKIHVMPKADLTEVMLYLLETIKQDPELQATIAAFKVYPWSDFNQNKEVIPRIVIYPAAGQKNAQRVLNKLYVLLKNIPGNGIRPRYNAQVTDLIWVAQGDSLYKSDPVTQIYFEQPNKVYYRAGFTQPPRHYYLLHPETGMPIIY